MFKLTLPGRARLRDAQTRLLAANGELRVADAMFRIAQPAMVTDASRRIIRVNEAFCELMGYAADEMVGNTPWMFRSNHHAPSFYAEMLESLLGTGRWEGEVWDRRKSGAVFPKWMTISVVRDVAGDITHFVATYLDMREHKQAQDRIQELQFYDALTRLPNRALLRDRLRHALAESGRSGQCGAVMLLDWDRFKALNDSLGHPRGDALLQQVGQRLSQRLRASDSVARLGGDEFAMVLPAIEHDLGRAAARAESLACELQQALGAPFHLGDADYQGTASVGLVLFQGEGVGADDLIKQAEMAMYQAKDDGRNRLHFFDAGLECAVAERGRLERELRHGIALGQLVLHYQPQVAVKDGAETIVGAEALVRWNHPERGLLPPGVFVPLAEESGLILALGRWVLETACAQLGAWQRQPGMEALSLAVNVSAAQFLEDDFAHRVQALLTDAGVGPRKLKLELTESLLVSDTEKVIATMEALAQRGVLLSLDDFGTGYSSLSYLKRLPLHQLKIDRSFVCDLAHGTHDAAIARSIAAMGQSLGLSVIAEGVETLAQRDALVDMGCSHYQGYYFSRPVPACEFVALCERERAACVAA